MKLGFAVRDLDSEYRKPAAGVRLKRENDLGISRGRYALRPFIAGEWPHEGSAPSIDNYGIFMDLHHNRWAMAYGIEQLRQRNPLALPRFASIADVERLVPTVIVVNECYPLREEGVNFYRLLLGTDVPAQSHRIAAAKPRRALRCSALRRDGALGFQLRDDTDELVEQRQNLVLGL